MMAQASGFSGNALVGGMNPLASGLEPAPPPPGSGASQPAEPPRNDLAKRQALAAQTPAAPPQPMMSPSQQPMPPAPPPPGMADAAKQHLQQLVAERGMDAPAISDATDRAHYLIELLAPLARKNGPLTQADIFTAASKAMKDGKATPEEVGELIARLPTDPSKLKAAVQQMLMGNILAAIHLPTVNAATPGAPSQPSPMGGVQPR